MATNTSIGYIEDGVFTWNIYNSMWSSFNTPYAYTVYKWTAIVLLLIIFEVILMFGPIVGIIVVYATNIFLWINDFLVLFNKGYTNKDGYDADRKICMNYSTFISSVWHGHEMFGRENIPDGPAIFYLYHGAVAYDAGYIYSKIQSAQERRLFCIGHKKEVNVWGFRRIHKATNVFTPSREEVIDLLKDGWQLYVYPGGLEESKVSDCNYRVYIPNNRKGIAHIVKSITDIKIIHKNVKLE
uniref:Phospholipid/glycerol acyltransferase domain-containing protein n=1 Tax=Strigamia maritima TaxID=126957 RepID=T1IM91_STRMM